MNHSCSNESSEDKGEVLLMELQNKITGEVVEGVVDIEVELISAQEEYSYKKDNYGNLPIGRNQNSFASLQIYDK